MAYSSILGADMAPTQPSGRDAELLGPSDNSDSGSDTIGTTEAARQTATRAGTGERGAVAGADAREGARHHAGPRREPGRRRRLPEADPDGLEMTDLDDDDAQRDGRRRRVGPTRAAEADARTARRPPRSRRVRALLRDTFGLSRLRPGQAAVIDRVLARPAHAGRHAHRRRQVAVLPVAGAAAAKAARWSCRR